LDPYRLRELGHAIDVGRQVHGHVRARDRLVESAADERLGLLLAAAAASGDGNDACGEHGRGDGYCEETVAVWHLERVRRGEPEGPRGLTRVPSRLKRAATIVALACAAALAVPTVA